MGLAMSKNLSGRASEWCFTLVHSSVGNPLSVCQVPPLLPTLQSPHLTPLGITLFVAHASVTRFAIGPEVWEWDFVQQMRPEE